MIVVVGLSHKTAPVAVREALAFPAERLADALECARREARLAEAMILSTCNRVELYGRVEEEPVDPAAFLAAYHGRPRAELERYLYRHDGEAAVRHAFRVAASLDSMVIGEPQILGQVREAYEKAEAAGALGAELTALRNHSLAAARRARTETGIGRNAVSVSHVAVELARKIFGDLRDRRVLLVGAGKMSELSARRLVASGARATVLGGRTLARAEELAVALGGRAVPFESLRSELAVSDIVISSTGAQATVVTRADVEVARHGRSRPLFIIDIAVPRDVDPAVAQLAGVFLYDIDDLRAVSEANLRERQKEAAAAEALVEREVRDFLAWQQTLEVRPLILELRQRAEEIRRAELEKARRRLGTLSPEQEAALDAATSAIVNKLLHAPTTHIREMTRNGPAPEHVSLIRKLLGL